MTTMFVQLRRVVYLLVLLHFCTCVAYANESSVTEVNAEQKVKEFKIMRNELKILMSATPKSQNALNDEVRACDVYSLRALNAVERLKSLTERAKVAMSLINTSTTQEEMKERWKEEETALQEANDVLSNITLAVNKTREAAEEFNKTLTKMEEVSKTIVSRATEFLKPDADFSRWPSDSKTEVKDLALISVSEDKFVQPFVAQKKSRVQPAFDAAKKGEEHAESLNMAVELAVQAFNKYLEKHGLKPEEEEADKVTPGNKNEESKLES
ncbi:uncharacterized protein TM35_000821000, partial [Trypanosoma theileri]